MTATLRVLAPGAASSRETRYDSKREALAAVRRLETERVKVSAIRRVPDGVGRTYAVQLVTKTGGK